MSLAKPLCTSYVDFLHCCAMCTMLFRLTSSNGNELGTRMGTNSNRQPLTAHMRWSHDASLATTEQMLAHVGGPVACTRRGCPCLQRALHIHRRGGPKPAALCMTAQEDWLLLRGEQTQLAVVLGRGQSPQSARSASATQLVTSKLKPSEV